MPPVLTGGSLLIKLATSEEFKKETDCNKRISQ
jgi:hypothetical protein